MKNFNNFLDNIHEEDHYFILYVNVTNEDMAKEYRNILNKYDVLDKVIIFTRKEYVDYFPNVIPINIDRDDGLFSLSIFYQIDKIFSDEGYEITYEI